MRADPERNGSISVHSRQASAQVLVLYSRAEILGAWRLSGVTSVLTGLQLLALGYPSPRGDSYVCVQLTRRLWDADGVELDYARIRRLVEASSKPFGSPATTSWAALTN